MRPSRGSRVLRRPAAVTRSCGYSVMTRSPEKRPRERLMKGFTLVLVAALLAGCGLANTNNGAPLPEEFSSPITFPDFSLPVTAMAVESRMRRSGCTSTDSNASGHALAGLAPMSGADDYRVARGTTPDGTRWFLLRSKMDPEDSYCGIALSSTEEGTNVAVTGIGRRYIEEASAAVERGDFFCQCNRFNR